MKSLKEATAQVFGAMVLVHTSAAAMRAVEAGEKVDATSLRLTLERAAGDLEGAHSTLVDAPDDPTAAEDPLPDTPPVPPPRRVLLNLADVDRDGEALILEQRIEEQRQALWRAAAIVQCVAGTAMDSRNPIDGTLNGNQAKDIEMALLAAHALIYAATGELEADVLLRPAGTAEEES